ncbi:hypothetical protein CCR95_05145 [Thiocystis minor]|uniref:sensor histidine kinase n=1 Tax=Thiocystis minor TaxID=61597 RepID=UPI00191289A9|nr:sensor histidine kinase [Thiocystis minor]MBK5963490.1 hypothetical protein [Thiocystis minor]
MFALQVNEIVPDVPRDRAESASPPVKNAPRQGWRLSPRRAVGVHLVFLVAFFWGWATPGHAARVLDVDGLAHVALGDSVQFFRDPTHRWTPDATAEETPAFVDWTRGGFLAFGPTRDRVWLRLHVRNPSDRTVVWYLDLGEALLAEAVLYRAEPPAVSPPERIALTTPRAERRIPVGRPVFRLETPARGEQLLYVGVSTDFSLRLPLMAYGDRAFVSALHGEGWFRGIWLGTMLLALVSHLFFWRILREPVYREAAGVVASVLAHTLIFWGNWTLLFDMPSTRMAATLLFGAVSLMMWFVLRATRQFLDLANDWPRVLPLYRVLEWGCVLLLCLSLIAPNSPWFSPLINVSGLIVDAVVILSIFKRWRRYSPTRLFAPAFLLGVTGSLPILLFSLGVVGLPPLVLTLAYPVGFFLDMVLLNLALADRIFLARRERDTARQRVKDLRRMYLDRLEHQVAERTRQLAHVNQHRDQIVSLIAHDLRGHLTSLTFLAILPNAPPGIVTLQQQLGHLLERLESQRRLPAGLVAGGESALNLRQVVESHCNAYRDRARQKGIQLSNRLLSNRDCWADPTLLDTLLDNLLNNAVKFCGAGDQIEVRERADGQPGFEVADNGPGVSDAVVPDLFRLDGTKHDIGSHGEVGTGNALSLCRAILRTLGGDLGWSPAPPNSPRANRKHAGGRGAIFSVRLPDRPGDQWLESSAG